MSSFTRPQLGAILAVFFCLPTLWVRVCFAEDWPREIVIPEGTITLYQPQPELIEGDRLTSRAAISVAQRSGGEAVFGAIWMDVRMATNRENRMVDFDDLKVTEARFPHATDEQIEKLGAALRQASATWDLSISMDRLLASLDLAAKEKAAADNLQTDPPEIIFADRPTVLVVLDGEPQLTMVEGQKLMQVVNTPYFIVLDTTQKRYYLKGDPWWYTAEEIVGPWATTPEPPQSVVRFASEGEEGEQPESKPTEPGTIPEILIRNEPADLIVTEGAPKFTPITGTDLLYISNCESDVFLEIGTQMKFALLAGRWYAATTLKGPWSYYPSDQLPAGFAQIPPESPKADVLPHVAGTEPAMEAVLETQIPQTAAINRNEATLGPKAISSTVGQRETTAAPHEGVAGDDDDVVRLGLVF